MADRRPQADPRPECVFGENRQHFLLRTAMFTECFVEADGFRIRYMEAGQGTPLVHLHGAGGLRLTPAHDLLSRQFRVIAFEMPGFGSSPENSRTRSMSE